VSAALCREPEVAEVAFVYAEQSAPERLLIIASVILAGN